MWGKLSQNSKEKTKKVKEWVTRILNLRDEVIVMVTELICTEDGCPPVETVILLLSDSGKTKQYKIHKSINDITLEDIFEVLINIKPRISNDDCC